MANITFTNKSDIIMLVTVASVTYKLAPLQTQSVQLQNSTTAFSVCSAGVNFINYFIKSAGIISKRHFVVLSETELFAQKDCQITLYAQTKKGRFMDEYEFAVPYCTDGVLTVVNYSVKDGDSFIREFEKSAKKGNRALLMLDMLDILGNALAGALILVVPFLLIWLFKDIQLAWDICSVAFIPIFAVIVVINRLFDKLKRTAWKKGKRFVLKNQIFKDYRSYFDSEYIRSVAQNNK